MTSFLIDFATTFCITYLILFTPALIFKLKTKNSLPLGFQKTIAIIAVVISLLMSLKKHFG